MPFHRSRYFPIRRYVAIAPYAAPSPMARKRAIRFGNMILRRYVAIAPYAARPLYVAQARHTFGQYIMIAMNCDATRFAAAMPSFSHNARVRLNRRDPQHKTWSSKLER